MLPKYNVNERSLDCGIDYLKDTDICQPFIFSNKTSREELKEFRAAVQQKAKEHEKEEELKQQEEENKKNEELTYDNFIDKAIEYVKNNLLLCSIIGGAILALLIIFIVKRGRR